MNPEEYQRMHELETEYWWFAGRRAIIEALLEFAQPKLANARGGGVKSRHLRLLDIGCGTGANLPMLLRAAGDTGQVVGADFSTLALRFSRNHAVAQRASLLQADAQNLPFACNSFDVVTMLDVLEHVEDDRQALAEIYRVLRPGGVLVLSVPAYQRLWSSHDEALHHFRRYEFHGLQKLLRQSGFDASRLSFAMSMMPPLAWMWRRLVLPMMPRQPKDAKRHSEGAVLPVVPGWVNRALVEYLRLEGRGLRRFRIRFGTSLVGAIFKPYAAIAAEPAAAPHRLSG